MLIGLGFNPDDHTVQPLFSTTMIFSLSISLKNADPAMVFTGFSIKEQ